MKSVALLVLASLLAVSAQRYQQLDSPTPPRLQIPGAEPVQGQGQGAVSHQRVSQFRRPVSRAYQQPRDQSLLQQQPPPGVIRVRRPGPRSRQQQLSLTPRPVSEEPESAEDSLPQPVREAPETNAIVTASPPAKPAAPSPQPVPSQPPPPPPSQVLSTPQLSPQPQPQQQPGRVLANRPLYLQPALYRPQRPQPALQGGFRPIGIDEEDNLILSQPRQQAGSPNPRAYLPTVSPPPPPQPPSPAPERPAPERPAPERLTQIPAAQLQLAQQLAAAQQQAIQQAQAQAQSLPSASPPPQPSSTATPQPPSARDEDDEDDEEEAPPAPANPNRRQSFRVTPNYLVTPSSLDLDDDAPQVFSSTPRRPSSSQGVFRPSPSLSPLDLDNNAFSPAPRPQQQHFQQRRPVTQPHTQSPAPTSTPRRPVLFRPERVNHVTASPNVHVQQLLKEDDDYRPISRTTAAPAPQRAAPARSQPSLQPRPRPQSSFGGGKRERKPVAQVLRRYREDNPDGSITWGYENDDGSFKEETIGVDCMVRGKYGYIDPDGNRREYTYQSGIPCTPAPPGREQVDDQDGGYVDYQNNQFVLPNGQAINLDEMVKNRKRKPVNKARNN